MLKVPAVKINQTSLSFCRNKETRLLSEERYPDYEVRTYQTEATTGKKWGVGIASFLIPGLGQAINGDWLKALSFFLSSLSLSVLSNAMKSKNPLLQRLFFIAALGVGVWSIVDAVKNATSKTTQIVPNNTADKSVNYSA